MTDITLHYTEKGRGTPLILLHGNHEDSTYFVHQMEHFSRKYRVIAVDTRGHGKSPRGIRPFTLDQFAEDLKSFLDKLQLRRVHLLGFSDGGNIALLFALKYPEYIEKLVLNGANLRPQGVKARYQYPANLNYLLLSLLCLFGRKQSAEREMLGLMVTQPHILRGRLLALTMPVLVIAGDNDMIKDSHTKEIAGSLKNGRLCVIEGDHFIALRNPDRFNECVERFLEGS